MGAGTRHRKAFLAANTVCIFCGGGKQSTSIEHCPPRAMFQNRSWPEGFEFASCHECNGGLSDHDAIIAVLGRIDPLNGKVDGDGQLVGLVKNLNRQYPGMLERMFANERPTEQVMPDGSRRQMVAVNIPDEVHGAVWTLAGKLTKAVFHMETGEVFPAQGCIAGLWASNADWADGNAYRGFGPLQDFLGPEPQVRRARTMLNDQFSYRFAVAPAPRFVVLQVAIGGAFALATVACADVGVLEDVFARSEAQLGRPGPFTMIQRQLGGA